MWGILAGTGLPSLPFLKQLTEHERATPYGDTTGTPLVGRSRRGDVVFMNRHGPGHTVPPHRINYRANLWKLQQLGVKRLVAVGAVGGITADLKAGDLVLPHQVLDYTWGREATYYTGGEHGVEHVDFTRPFCDDLRSRLLVAAAETDIALRDGGVCAVTQGPRLETAAEVDRLERDGATLVGMTVMPEAVLARELGLDYAMIAAVVNAAAGRGSRPIHAELESSIDGPISRAIKLLQALVG